MTATLRLDGSTLWLGATSRPYTDADRHTLANLAARYRTWQRPHRDAPLRVLGAELHAWLDPPAAFARDLHRPDATLTIAAPPAETALLDAPWELLHDGAAWCVDHGLEIIRCPDHPPVKERRRSPGALTLLFMAAAPEGTSRLAYEAEEAAIDAATAALGIDLFVEETGTARELGQRLDRLAQHGAVDVLHLSCHGSAEFAPLGITEPVLWLEDPVGAAAPTTATALAAAVDLHRVGLVVVSACETARPSATADSLAAALLAAGARAVLGWAAPVSDHQAIHFAAALYGDLARGHDPAHALRRARRALRDLPDAAGTYWHLARLLLAPAAGAPLATLGGPLRRVDHGERAFLDAGRLVPVAAPDAFVGRRRPLQAALRALHHRDRAGVLITGQGHQGKSSLAARLVRRLDEHRPVVCHGDAELRARPILARLAHAAGHPIDAPTLERAGQDPHALRAALDPLLAAAPRLLLILDDAEQILDLDPTPPRVRAPDRAAALAIVVEAFDRHRHRHHRLIITSRATFTLPDHESRDLIARHLEPIELHPMTPAELRLLREVAPTRRAAGPTLVDDCLAASHGNPGLADLLLPLAVDSATKGDTAALRALLARLGREASGRDTIDRWITDVITTTLTRLTPTERHALDAARVLTHPVPEATARALLTEVAAAPEALARLCALQLIETHRTPTPPRLRINPLVARCLPEPAPAELALLARALLPHLAPAGPTDPARAAWLTHLALAAADLPTLAREAEPGVAHLLRTFQIPAARHLGRAAVRALDAAGHQPAPRLLLWLADAIATEDPTEAATLLARLPADTSVLLRLGRHHQQAGRLDDALRCSADAAALLEPGSRDHAVARGDAADIHEARGELDEALRIRREEQLPVYERLGDVRERAVTMGKVADIHEARGELDEALRIRREEELPVFERLGDVQGRAVAMGKVADILQARGELDEALRILREEVLPAFQRLGDVRSRAVTMGKVADILQARGALDEALRIRREEQLPVYERLGDVRGRAVTMGKVADIHAARGELDEALRILREEVLPVYERMGDVRLLLVDRTHVALYLLRRGRPEDGREAIGLLAAALVAARRLRIPEAATIEGILRQLGAPAEWLATLGAAPPPALGGKR